MTTSRGVLTLFHNGEFWDGLHALCRERADKAVSKLKADKPAEGESPAAYSERIQSLQREIRLWERELPGLKSEVEAYAAQHAVPPK